MTGRSKDWTHYISSEFYLDTKYMGKSESNVPVFKFGATNDIRRLWLDNCEEFYRSGEELERRIVDANLHTGRVSAMDSQQWKRTRIMNFHVCYITSTFLFFHLFNDKSLVLYVFNFFMMPSFCAIFPLLRCECYSKYRTFAFASSFSIGVAPTYLRIEDIDGNEVTQLSLILYMDTVNLSLKTDGLNPRFSVDKDLPTGIKFADGKLTGTVVAAYPSTDLLFTATTDEGNVTAMLTLSASCPYDVFLVDNTCDFQFEADGKSYNPTGVSHVCLPRQLYHYNLTCPDNHGVSINDTSSLYFVSGQGHSEGVFDLRSTSTPQLEFTDAFVVMEKLTVEYPILIRGRFNSIEFEPPLPACFKMFRWNLIASFPDYEYRQMHRMLVKTSEGVSIDHSFAIRFYTCESGQQFVNIAIEGEYEDYANITTSEGSHLLRGVYKTWNTCLKSAIQFNMSRAEATFNSFVKITNGHQLIAEYEPRNGKEIRKYRFNIAIDRDDTYSYFYGTPTDEMLSDSFDDSAWPSAYHNTWPAFSSSESTAVFRRLFEVDDISLFTHLIVDVLAEGELRLVFNGVELVHTDVLPGTSYERIVLPISSLHSGSNVLAAVLQTERDTPLFDCAVQLITTMRLSRHLHGIAYENQTSISTPANAFDDDFYSAWKANSFPATLGYSFPHNEREIITKFSLYRTQEGMPTKFRFEGVNPSEEPVVLLLVESTQLFSSGGFEEFSFPNTQPFASYQFVFEEAVEDKPIEIRMIHLYSCPILQCSVKQRADPLIIDETVYARCPLFLIGSSQIRCEDQDFYPVVVDDRSACLSRCPEKEYAFVDFTFTVKPARLDFWTKNEDAITNLFVTHLVLGLDEITYPLVREYEEDASKYLSVMTRFVLFSELGSLTQKRMKRIVPKLTELMQEATGQTVTVELTGDIVLREYVNIALIVTICVVAILIVFVAFYLYAHRGKRGSRRLSRKNAELQDLLNE